MALQSFPICLYREATHLMLVSHTSMLAKYKTMAVFRGELLLWLILHPFSKPLNTMLGYSSDFLNNAHRDSKHCNCVASLYKHMGKLQSAIILIPRYKSKFPKVKSLVLTHSAFPLKIMPPSAPKPP